MAVPTLFSCGSCRNNVGEKSKSIECSFCTKRYHFKCSELSNDVFYKHAHDPTLNWRCSRCKIYRCKKCVKVIGRTQAKVLCICCNEWYHKKCKGNIPHYTPNSIFMCVSCKSDNIPFFNISDAKLKNCTSQSVALPKSADFDCKMFCAVCERRNKNLNSIKCTFCKCLTHLKCTEMTRSKINEIYLH